jgi:hypothetical protein
MTEYKHWTCGQPNWVKIDNIKAFNLDEIKIFHPSDPRYIEYWQQEKKYCIEGKWTQQFGKWMHMPGCLYFYGKFGIIVDTNKFTKVTKKTAPKIQDLEWEQAFHHWEARGFSGYKNDDEYTSDSLYFTYVEKGVPNTAEFEDMDPDLKEALLNVINKKGKLKKYLPPRQNLRRVTDEPLGIPLFQNPASNQFVFGSRGSGKSFFSAIAVNLYQICFDGAVKYDKEVVQKIEIAIGSGQTDKSGELIQKLVDAMNEFATNPRLGVWGQQGGSDWTPNPFYRDMNGPIKPGNKQVGGWAQLYEQKINGSWVGGFGTGTRMFHVSYSSNKKDGAEAAAGGRYNVSTFEEVGLSDNVIEVWNSNKATVTRNGVQFGIQYLLGTSGNVELVLQSKEMFTNPAQFNIVEYEDVWENTGNIGFFIPAYMTYRQFKDRNGNTDVKAAREHWLSEYMEAAQSANPKTLRMHCMNYPDIPSHMWVTDAQYLLPYEEAVERERQLMDKKLYQTIGTAIELRWDSAKPNGVTYDIVHNPNPFYDFPVRKDMERMDGEVMMYQPPQEVRGSVPNDMYFFVHDPYVSDNQEDGASLGVTYGFLNPKYSVTHDGNQLVCSYIGKPKGGKKQYYQNLEKLLAFYGNPFRGLVYEANRGEFCRSYFEKKSKLHLLALRPQHAKGDSIYEKKVTQFGYMVGARGAIGKMTMVDDTNDLLLTDVTRGNGEVKLIETLPCIFLVRQIAQFTLDGNFDAVSSLILVPTFLSEQESFMTQVRRKKESNRLQFLSTNSAIHDQNYRHKKRSISRLV